MLYILITLLTDDYFGVIGGYPENPGPNPAHPGGLSRHDCVVMDNLDDALCFAFRTDNSGPPVDVKVCIYL